MGILIVPKSLSIVEEFVAKKKEGATLQEIQNELQARKKEWTGSTKEMDSFNKQPVEYIEKNFDKMAGPDGKLSLEELKSKEKQKDNMIYLGDA